MLPESTQPPGHVAWGDGLLKSVKKESSRAPSGPASGSMRLRERHVRSAGVFATEHAEEVGPDGPRKQSLECRDAWVERVGCGEDLDAVTQA